MNLPIIHPLVVHFPIAFYFLELLLLIQWTRKKDPAYLRFSRFVFALGFIFMIAALASGFNDAGGFSGIRGPVQRHFYAAISVFVIYTLRAFVWKMGKPDDPRYRVLQLSGALIGNLLIALTGFYGGIVVYG